MMDIYIIDANIDYDSWRSFVIAHPNGNYFQLPENFNFLKNIPSYSPFVFAAISSSTKSIVGILSGVIQKEDSFYGSLTARSIIWGGPLVEDNSTSIARLLIEQYDQEIGKKVIYSQFRNLFESRWLIEPFEACNFEYTEHLNYLVKTNNRSKEEITKNLSSSKARQIKKALQTATIVEATSEDEVNKLYSLLKTLYTQKVKKPLPPKIFFIDFFHVICHQGLGKILLIKTNGNIIGGIVCPLFPGKAIYEWYIVGLDKEFKNNYPSILATWAAIEIAYEHNLEHFDFLGAGKPNDDYGVREFKEKFGGQLVSHGRFEKVHKPILMKIGRWGLYFYKKLMR
jgi:lipid II:glycine glycyltransferase (peptidoglycan interpeptide bridge formation enzyme)